jgi:hypothetical protein
MTSYGLTSIDISEEPGVSILMVEIGVLGGSRFLRNVGAYVSDYTASHPGSQ